MIPEPAPPEPMTFNGLKFYRRATPAYTTVAARTTGGGTAAHCGAAVVVAYAARSIAAAVATAAAAAVARVPARVVYRNDLWCWWW